MEHKIKHPVTLNTIMLDGSDIEETPAMIHAVKKNGVYISAEIELFDGVHVCGDCSEFSTAICELEDQIMSNGPMVFRGQEMVAMIHNWVF